MDLLTIARTIWRHKWITLPVVALTALGIVYVMVIQPPTYESDANILIANPPNPPTASQIAKDPSLASGSTDNPLAKINNLVQVADVLIQVATSQSAKQELAQEGVSPGYKVALDASLQTPPAIDILGVGSSPQAAIAAAKILANSVRQDLYKIQESQHIAKAYMLTTFEYVSPTTAGSSSSRQLRTVIGVLAIGLIVLLLGVSIAQAFGERKKNRSRPGDESAPLPVQRSGSESPASQPFYQGE